MPDGKDKEGTERREFVRVNVVVPVRYSFLDMNGQRLPPGLSEGATTNLSAAGMLLQGRLGDVAWAQELLLQRMAVAVSVMLPTDMEPVKTIARAAWVESIDPATRRCNLGLMFREITREDQDRLFHFIIRSQLG